MDGTKTARVTREEESLNIAVADEVEPEIGILVLKLRSATHLILWAVMSMLPQGYRRRNSGHTFDSTMLMTEHVQMANMHGIEGASVRHFMCLAVLAKSNV